MKLFLECYLRDVKTGRDKDLLVDETFNATSKDIHKLADSGELERPVMDILKEKLKKKGLNLGNVSLERYCYNEDTIAGFGHLMDDEKMALSLFVGKI